MSAEKEVKKLSRRDFLRKAGTGATALVAAHIASSTSYAASTGETENGKAWGILINLTRCTGCNSCALACKEVNGLPYPDLPPRALDRDAYTFVDECLTHGENGEEEVCYVKRQCMHCLHPACASACTVSALRKTPEGPVVYDASKCIGCRYCQYACPFGVPTYEWEDPLGLIYKCQMCTSRLSEGQQPACVEACPSSALHFGEREQLLTFARAQIASNPDLYIDHIYGEREVGGTSILYMSAVPFSELDFPALGLEPIPRYAEAIMKLTPVIALTAASIASGLYWISKRRQLASVEIHADMGETGANK